jgi:rod shape-determining protein MreC
MRVRTRTWFGFVVAIGLLFMVASRFGVFDPIDNGVLTAMSPVESALGDVTSPVADFVNNVTDINRLSNENHDLRAENERLVAENARLTESERELRQQQQLLQIRTGSEDDVFVRANVFARDPGNQREMIAIDRGTSDGLQKGMVVLSPQGSLVGSITEALSNVSWVTLITDQTSAVPAVIQESRVQGVVAGSADGSLTIEFVEETADVKEGDQVLTSGISGDYPAGELVGQVVQVESVPQELFKSVHVQPLADLSKLEDVLVLQSFLPRDTAAP